MLDEAKNTEIAVAIASSFNDEYGLSRPKICGKFGCNWYLPQLIVNGLFT